MELAAATSNASQPYYPFSRFSTDREFEADFADKIQQRMLAGSPLLFIGSENSFSALLQKGGLISHGNHVNPFDFPQNGAKSCCLWLPEAPFNVGYDVGESNALAMKKSILTMVLKSNKEHRCIQPLIVCLGRNSTHIIDDKSLVHLLEVQRDYHMEILIADYAAFTGLPDDVKSIYLGNKIFDKHWKQDRQ